MKTVYRLAIWCALAALAMPAQAQTVSRSEPDDPARAQVQIFEMILKTAVETGSRNFAKRAQEMVPVVFEPSDAPIVNGVAVRAADRTDFVFHIQVPFIWPAIQVMTMMANRHAGALASDGRPQRVAAGDRVQADTVVEPDPLNAPAVNPANRPDLEREYAMNVRMSLVDAVLDNSGGLPIGAADTLLVFASGSDSTAGVVNPLQQSVPRKLVLSIRGSDLTDFRQGKITRDEAKQRVKVASF